MSNRFANITGPIPMPQSNNSQKTDPTTHPRFLELTDEQVRRVEHGEQVELPEQPKDPGTSHIKHTPAQDPDLSTEANNTNVTSDTDVEIDVSELEAYLNNGGSEQQQQQPIEEQVSEPVEVIEEEKEEDPVEVIEEEKEEKPVEEVPENTEAPTDEVSSGENLIEECTILEFPDVIRSYKKKSYTWTITEENLKTIIDWQGNKPMEKKALAFILGSQPLKMSTSSENDIMKIVDDIWKKAGRDTTLFLMELSVNTPHAVMEVTNSKDAILGLGYLGPIFITNTAQDGTQTLFVFNSISLKQNRASGYEFNPSNENLEPTSWYTDKMTKICWYLEKDDDLSLATLVDQSSCNAYFVVDGRSRFVD